MTKIIRIILIIVISVAASAVTTVSLMLRYSKPLGRDIVKSNDIIFERAEKEPVDPARQIVKNLIPLQGNSAEKGEYSHSLSDGPRYFDHALLSRDIAVFSEKVSRFNEVLSREIQRLKNESSKKNTSP